MKGAREIFERAKKSLERGLKHRQAGQMKEAEGAYLEALALFDQVPGPSGAQASVATLNNLAAVLQITGDVEGAASRYRDAIARAEASNNVKAQALSWGNLGALQLESGDLERASEATAKALTLYVSAGDPAGRGNQLGNLGLIAQARGDLDAAGERFTEAIGAFLAAGHFIGAGRTLWTMGELARQRGDREGAEEAYGRAGDLLAKAGDAAGLANVVRGMGQLALRAGDIATARGYFEQGLSLHEQMQDVKGQAAALMDLGNIASQSAEANKALDLWRRAGALAAKAGSREGQANAEMASAQQLLALGRLAEVEVALERALAWFMAIEHHSGIASAMILQAQLAMLVGRLDQAEAKLSEAGAMVEDTGLKPLQASLTGSLSGLAERRGQMVARRHLLEEALKIYTEVEGWASVHHARLSLLELDIYAGRFEGVEQGLDDPRFREASLFFDAAEHKRARLRLTHIRAVLHQGAGDDARAAELHLTYGVEIGRLKHRLDQMGSLAEASLLKARAGIPQGHGSVAALAAEAQACGARYHHIRMTSSAAEIAAHAGEMDVAATYITEAAAGLEALVEPYPYGEAFLLDTRARIAHLAGRAEEASELLREVRGRYEELEDALSSAALARALASGA